MPMEALICPQCGGQVDEVDGRTDLARCEYCNMHFRVGSLMPPPSPVVPDRSVDVEEGSYRGTVAVVSIVIAFVASVLFYEVNGARSGVAKTTKTALTAANDAQSSANAIRLLANSMANITRQNAINALPPPQTGSKKTSPK